MLRKRFYVSWLFASISMYVISLLWHGFILNDFVRLSYPQKTYFTLSALAYLAIGFVITFLISYTQKKMHLFRKGFLSGAVVGALVYLIALVFGVSFQSSNADIYQYLLDFGWQVVEQGVGGFFCAFVYLTVARFQRETRS